MHSPFSIRGYYTIPGRNRIWGEREWTRYVECLAEDGGNLWILWIAGGFASRQFPETWHYNSANPNVREDFFRRVIDRAHDLGVKVVLGLGTFCYDGVNRIPLARPDLAGQTGDGDLAPIMGLHSMGRILCPSNPQAQDVMFNYCEEMFAEFYPNADGFFLESSDYAVCQCSQCRDDYFAKEYEFVRRISERVWAEKPDAAMIIYPHYLLRSGIPVDPRYTLFFTPHSAHVSKDAISAARSSIYWALELEISLEDVQTHARTARDNDIDGFVVGMEAMDYERFPPELDYDGTKPEFLMPYDAKWVRPGEFAFEDPIVAVMRATYTTFAANPDASRDEWVEAVRERVLGDAGQAGEAAYLLRLASILQTDMRNFKCRGPIVYPWDFPAGDSGEIADKKARYKEMLSDVESIERRLEKSGSLVARRASEIARWVLYRWEFERWRLD